MLEVPPRTGQRRNDKDRGVAMEFKCSYCSAEVTIVNPFDVDMDHDKCPSCLMAARVRADVFQIDLNHSIKHEILEPEDLWALRN